MDDSANRNGFSLRSGPVAGTIRRIRLENFMCHSNLEIEFCDFVNFITGQNGSGKSAILTALCIAFGCRAKATNRAATLKDFIKTGSSYAAVQVEIKNEGEDAYKPEVYGDIIIVERRITESTTSTVIKDQRGRRISSKKEELRELVEHFNIDVENPCVIMSQDKSREFLHSGNAKDKFKFFFKATLLQQVDDLLQSIEELLESANGLIQDLEKSIEPILRELNELQEKIKNMEHIEELSERVKEMKIKLAWSWVYDVDRELLKQNKLIEKLRTRVPACEGKINQKLETIEGLRSSYENNRSDYELMVQKTSEVKRMKNELQEQLSMAAKSMLELEEEYRRRMGDVQKMRKKLKSLEQQVHDIKEQDMQNTQAEESKMQEKVKALQDDIDDAHLMLKRLMEEENSLSDGLLAAKDEIKRITDQTEDYERKVRDIKSSILELRRHQTNKVTAFGGEKVIQLLRIIESRHREFTRPPIGPIGAHVTLTQGDVWACAVENAVGRLLNAFIVTNVKDSHLLRSCARHARYDHLQIIIYDFSIPRYNIPFNHLPQTRHPITLSVLQSDNATVLNVLVDKGSVERQVLVQNYEVGKNVAFEERVPNLKEVYTAEGHKMFSRGSVQTILPPNKRARTGRLCSSYDDQIKNLEKDASHIQEQALKARQRKRVAEQELYDLQEKLQSAKRSCQSKERDLSSKRLLLEDVKRSYAAEAGGPDASSVDELYVDISRVQAEIQEKEVMLEKLQSRLIEARDEVGKLKGSLTNLHESANEDIKALNKAEEELTQISKQIEDLEMGKSHYEKLLNEKILPDIKLAEAKYQELEHKRKESYEKASYICPESEVEALGDCKETSPEQFSAQLTRMTQRLQRARERCTESIDDLRMVYDKKQRKIFKKQKTYENFRQQLQASQRAINLRRDKFKRNASLLKRQLTWNFNSHLGKKGISGNIMVKYEEKTLLIEVKMPQDASSTAVRDTRGLSGGERSFSTLCFALALHQMTEAPFRAMDEFDVFMDAVSRKISLDTLVDFALAQGSQWIFISPHDISMVKQGERVKKQQMAAPRS